MIQVSSALQHRVGAGGHRLRPRGPPCRVWAGRASSPSLRKSKPHVGRGWLRHGAEHHGASLRQGEAMAARQGRLAASAVPRASPQAGLPPSPSFPASHPPLQPPGSRRQRQPPPARQPPALCSCRLTVMAGDGAPPGCGCSPWDCALQLLGSAGFLGAVLVAPRQTRLWGPCARLCWPSCTASQSGARGAKRGSITTVPLQGAGACPRAHGLAPALDTARGWARPRFSSALCLQVWDLPRQAPRTASRPPLPRGGTGVSVVRGLGSWACSEGSV